MPLENLTIRRASLHEVHRRADDRTIVTPTYATHLFELDANGLAVFQRRVLQAFQSDAKCMRMTISAHAAGTVSATGAAIVAANDAEFVMQSRTFADLLATAQTSRAYPGGLVVTFDGTVGHPARRFFGIMKAEMHEAFLKGDNLQARFVDSVFLSPKTKLCLLGRASAPLPVDQRRSPGPSPAVQQYRRAINAKARLGCYAVSPMCDGLQSPP